MRAPTEQTAARAQLPYQSREQTLFGALNPESLSK